MKKLSNKGFTLIELLATILIIGLVLGLTTYGIISSVDKAKTTSTTISVSGIKEAARTYSNEYTDDTWKASNKLNNIYFCTTIQELINKGLLDKNAKNVEGNTIGLNDYIAVVKDKTTKVIKKEFVLTPQISENETDKIEAFNYCTGGKKPENIKKLPTIKGEKTYTDTIIAEFTDAEFKTKDGTSSNITERKCSYAKSRIDGGNAEFIENNNTTINGNKCKITGLESNTGYDIRVCMTSSNDSEACTTKNIKTLDIKEPTISINGNDSIKITYDDTNIIDENGQAIASYKYGDYGKTTKVGNLNFYNEICYTSGVYDELTGLYYFNSRYYNPDTATFITQDSYRGEIDSYETWNLYAYCGGNPINYVDPSGHKAKKIKKITKQLEKIKEKVQI